MTDNYFAEMPDPITPNSAAEAELEDRAFHGANHQDLPDWAKTLIGDLWRELVVREKWYFELNPAEAIPVDLTTGKPVPMAPNDG